MKQKVNNNSENGWNIKKTWKMTGMSRIEKDKFNQIKSALIWPKNALILEESALFACIYGLIYYSKCTFKSIFDKKHQNFSLWTPSFVCRTWNIYQISPISRILRCPQKIPIARLIRYFNDSRRIYKNSNLASNSIVKDISYCNHITHFIGL